jgi:hypothetical protein
MCAEHDPLECHRALLISRDLVDDGIPIVHIHADGHLEPHADAIGRLLQQLGLPEHDLFRTPSEMVDEAYSRQEARVAYVDQRLGQEGLESKP